MEEKTANGLREQQMRRRRINRMKMSILAGTAIWILLLTVLIVILLVKVILLESRLDELAESVISVEQVVETQREKGAGSPEEKTNVSDMIPEESSIEENTEDGVSEENLTQQDSLTQEDSLTEALSTEDNLQTQGEEQKVYLTFDDGPSENTAKILDILKERNIKATFFVIGKEDEESKALYRRIVAEGHTLGMHSFSHRYDAIYESKEAFVEDLKHLQSYLEEVTGVTPEIMRFPGGSSNQVSNVDMTELIRYLNEQGITYYDWNVASGDATSQVYTPDELVQNVMNDVVKYKTSIVLMHDSSAKATTVEALVPMIDQLQEMGAQLLPIDETTKPIQHITADSVE